jgi:peptidoglycan/LPS O-acetylase OafA/YrhL
VAPLIASTGTASGDASTTTAPGGRGEGHSRQHSLDAVRGFAILLVLGHHAAWRFPVGHDDVVAGFFKHVGWIGVDLFFALSGYLIVTILQRDVGRADIRGFFLRRFFRIAPIFFVAIATYAIATFTLGYEAGIRERLWMPALLLNGWLIPVYGTAGVPFTITWSLSVEEFAYLVLGFTAWLSPAYLRRALLAFLVIALAVRVVVLVAYLFPTGLLYFFVPARLDAIAFGGLGALGAYDRWLRWEAGTLVAGVATIGLMVGFQRTGIESTLLPAFGYAAFGLAAAVWVTGLARRARVPGMAVRALAAVGKVSYFIYLFHLFFLEATRIAGHWLIEGGLSYWPGMAIAAAACFLAARLSWRLVEDPLIRYAHRPRPA